MEYELVAECLGAFPLYMFAPVKDENVFLQKVLDHLQAHKKKRRERFFETAEVLNFTPDGKTLEVNRQGKILTLRLICFFEGDIKIYAEVNPEDDYMAPKDRDATLYLVYTFMTDADDPNNREDDSSADC